MNRRDFLGAAVAATLTSVAGEADAQPAPDRTIDAHETPEGVLYRVSDATRVTDVLARRGPSDNFGEGPSEPLPPAFIVVSYMLAAPAERDATTRRVLPAPLPDGRIVNSFSRPPSLEDVVAFHDACCADVSGRVIDASEEPAGVVYKIVQGNASTYGGGGVGLSSAIAFHEACCAAKRSW